MANRAADLYAVYVKAFNAGDIEATLACYEPHACFVSKSGRTARGTAELREVYRRTFLSKPQMDVVVRKVIPAGDDLALVIADWTTTAASPDDKPKILSGIATDVVRRQHDGTWKILLDNPNGVEQYLRISGGRQGKDHAHSQDPGLCGRGPAVAASDTSLGKA